MKTVVLNGLMIPQSITRPGPMANQITVVHQVLQKTVRTRTDKDFGTTCHVNMEWLHFVRDLLHMNSARWMDQIEKNVDSLEYKLVNA
jgi:hypothetical protein